MTHSDLNYWGELAVPVGLVICFWPALLYWVIQEIKAPKEQPTIPPRKSKKNR